MKVEARHFLFYTRLALYGLVLAVPYIMQPAVSVAFDNTGKLAWFLIAPLGMFAAFYLRPPRFPWWSGFAAALAVTAFCILFFADFDLYSMLLFSIAGGFGFFWTMFVFAGRRFLWLSVLEMFAFALVYFKVLNFSRSAEDVAEVLFWPIKWVFALAAITFLIHGLVLYLAAFPDRSQKSRRNELLAFFGLAVPLVIAAAIFLPKEFVQNDVALNELREEPPPQPRNLEEGPGGLPEDGGGQSPDTQNGKPLGERDEKYPSELQNGGDQPGGETPEREQRPDENRGGQGGGAEGREGQGGQGGGSGRRPRPNDPGQGQGGGGGGFVPREGGGQGGQERDPNEPELRGVPADQWDNFANNQNNQGGSGSQGGGGGQGGEGQSGGESQNQQNQNQEQQNEGGSGGEGGNQKAVMVIVSPVDPVYAAESYWGDYDVEAGWAPTSNESEPLNNLAGLRLLETWQDQVSSLDARRQPVEIFYLSTLKTRQVAYRPFKIEPTVQDTAYHPFDLSYKAVSRVSLSQPEEWATIPRISPAEQERYAEYLKTGLPDADARVFQNFANRAVAGKDGYFERVEAVLKSMSGHRYERGFTENTNVESLRKFLLTDKRGDCTEFAATTALLLRYAGIPSRVVVGYLAARDLQTRAHARGAYELRKKIKPLQNYPPEHIYLVTDAHHHAWVQILMPGYGWVDFESTAFAIPPEPSMNPNNQDVIIPLIDEEAAAQQKPSFVFPWRTVLYATGILAVVILIGLYLYRIFREAYFNVRGRSQSPQGLAARLKYVLMKFAREGYRLKAPHETPLEYAKAAEPLEPFADRHTELRYRENYAPGEQEGAWKAYDASYSGAISRVEKQERRGFYAWLRRIFSLRSLYY